MSRRSVVFLILSALLLTGFSVALSRRDSRDWRATRSRRIFPFPWQDIASIRINRPGRQELHFSREPGGEWRIVLEDGIADTLDTGAVEELAALATLTWRDPRPGRNAPDPETAVTMTASSQFGGTVSLAFGNLEDNLRSATIDGDQSLVYGVSQDLLTFLDWPSHRFRKYYLASVAGGTDPGKIVLQGDPGNPDLTITLERDQQGWALRSPVAWPADDARLDHLLRWLDRLRGESIVAESVEDPAEYGFDHPSASVEAWYDTPLGRIHRRIEFGKGDGEDGVYARVADRSPVFVLPVQTLGEISLTTARVEPETWVNFFRRRNLNQFNQKRPQQVTVEQLLPKPVTLVIDQDRATGRWSGTLTADGQTRTFMVDPPDATDRTRPLTALFSGLASLRIKEFLADVPPGPETLEWTAYPAWRIGLTFDDGTSAPELTLYADDAKGTLAHSQPYQEGTTGPTTTTPLLDPRDQSGIAFSLGGNPAVMQTYDGLAYFLCLPPYRYQSRQMLDLSIGDWRRVEQTIEGDSITFIRPEGEVNEQWWRQDSPSEPLMDGNNRFVTMLLTLSQLRSDGFVSDVDGDIAEFGLDQPEITAIVYSSPEPGGEDDDSPTRLFELALGKIADKEGRRYARLNETGPVFLVPAEVGAALGERYE
ncbi:MAG: DUF4340 domain-containing protein [Planctomycetaceae bacterium]|nr:DUF4340 domain-containing protein [Planctomycetaceae bacterium]